jgi:hypothetical protein
MGLRFSARFLRGVKRAIEDTDAILVIEVSAIWPVRGKDRVRSLKKITVWGNAIKTPSSKLDAHD